MTPPGWAADADTRKATELKWAKGVAADFIEAIQRINVTEAAALTTASYHKAIIDDDREKSDRTFFGQIYFSPFKDGPVAIVSEDIAPESDEAVFAGTLKKGEEVADFKLRVIKEKESGKWRVSFFRFAGRKKGAQEAK